VRCNTVFQNIVARIVNSGGSERAVANLLIDFLWGIDDKLGELSAAVSGANFDIRDKPDDPSVIQFYTPGTGGNPDVVLYEMNKPQVIQGSNSISVSGGIASVILDENSPIIQAIAAALVNYVQSVPGKGLSTNDYTTAEKSWIASQATITSVTNANGLSLEGGVLGFSATGFLDIFYPIGSIYETTNNAYSTAAAINAHFGGTWEAFGAGRVLVGINSADAEFDTILETGGAKTHTLTVDQMPSHGHNRQGWRNVGSGSIQCCSREQISGDGNSYGVQATGGGQAHNNIQPYIVVYRYRRTA
jgi:microcystin-dependent protein